MTDIVIRNGTVFDGTGAEPFRGDVAISGGRIESVGESGASAPTVLDADGLAVAPGFLDIHTHSELAQLANPGMAFKVAQGVTTEVLGNCGFSVAPVSDLSRDTFREMAGPVLGHESIEWEWDDLPQFLDKLSSAGVACNTATLVGHGALRAAVMGFDDRPPVDGELAQMQAELDACMAAGALGLSTGLIYVPGCYAKTEELIELTRAVARHGGVYVTHLRDQSNRLLEAVGEAVTIGREAGCAVQISHHKCAGVANRGKIRDSLGLLDEAMAAGTVTGSDMYPYLAGSSTLISLFPPWSLGGGVPALLERLADAELRQRILRDFREGLPDWENRTRITGWEAIHVSSVAGRASEDLVGRNLSEIAAQRGVTPEEAACDIVEDGEGRIGYIGYNSSEDDLETMLRHPRTAIGSDGLDVGDRPHPRLYGTFPRVLGHYCRERGVIDLATAVHKMTGLPAAQMGLESVGRLAPGLRADVVLFDPDRVADRATFEDPRQFPEGIPHVFVGGTAVVRDGQLTGALPGNVLRRGGCPAS